MTFFVTSQPFRMTSQRRRFGPSILSSISPRPRRDSAVRYRPTSCRSSLCWLAMRTCTAAAPRSWPSVWGHAWSLPDEAAPTLDGTIVGTGSQWHGYQMFGEHHAIVSRPSDHTATIGLVAHEMGHAFGFLPDLYDTDGTSDGIGRWGVMGFGAAARLDLRRVGREWHGPCPRRGGADRSGFDPRTRSSPSARATRWRWCATRAPGHVSLIDGPRACSSDGCRKCQNTAAANGARSWTIWPANSWTKSACSRASSSRATTGS